MIRKLERGEDITAALAGERLGIPAVLFFVMSAAAPLTVVAGTLSTAYAVTGNLGLPVAFVAVGLVLGLFSVGYVAMSRHLPHAGAFYAYVAHGLGRPLGVAAAWVSLLAYDLLQVSLYGAIGAAGAPLVRGWAGIELPWWVFALAAWALVAALGVARVDLNGGVLAALLVCEVTLVVVYDTVFLSHPAAGADPMAWSVLSPGRLADPGVGAILAIAVLGFVGFESAVVFAEESRDPRRTIPVTTYLSVALIAVLYGVSSWAMAVAAGPAHVAGAARDEGTDLVFDLASGHLGPLAADVGHVLFGTSIVAAMISFHNTTARYVFALGRERVLPAVFGRTSLTGSPRAGSVAQSVVGLAVVVAFAVSGADPVVRLFYTASTSGALGVLVLLVLAGLAVLRFFAGQSRGENLWRTTVAPFVSLLGVGVIATLVVANVATLLGVAPASPLRWGVPAAFVVTAALGCAYGLFLKVRRPAVYAAIGLGAKAAALPAAPTRYPSDAGFGQLHPHGPLRNDSAANGSTEIWEIGR